MDSKAQESNSASSDRPVPTVKDGGNQILKRTDAIILQAIQDGKHPAVACKEAGIAVPPAHAKTYVEHIKSKYSDGQGGLLVALENIGVDLDTVATSIKEGLQATRPAKAGQMIIDKPDYGTRHKYVETALDVMGAKAPKQHVVESVSTHEHTVAFVDGIRSNPEVLRKIMDRLNKSNVIEIEAENE
jgi:hypothetical protein